MRKKILITGASGLIGTNLVDLLLKNSYCVLGIAKSFPLKKIKLEQFNNINYTALEGDICNQDFIEKTIVKFSPDIVVHLAAQAIVGDANRSSIKTFDVNIRGTWILFETLKRLRNLDKVIVASSDKAYGTHECLPYKENYELKAIHPYDVSKKITENLAMSYFHTFGLPVVITRCANVFGAYDLNWSRIVPGTIRSCLNNENIVLRSDGQQKRSYVYAEDVANAYLKIIKSQNKKVVGQVFNIGNDKQLSVLEIVQSICKKLSIDMEKRLIIEARAKYEIENQSISSDKIKTELEWEEKFHFSKGLSKTIEWYKTNKDIFY
jgi:CDP-glucose 4,6-dehydratase